MEYCTRSSSTVFRRYVAWLKQGDNWLILVPWLVTAILALFLRPALMQIKPLKRLVEHWLTLLLVGAFCLMLGAVYGLMKPELPHLLFGSLPLGILGIWFCAVGYKRKLPPLPTDCIMVSVALFTHVTLAAEEDAGNVRQWLVRKLQEMEEEKQPIKVRRDDIEIKGATEEEMRLSAVEAFQGKAHIVIWGEVQRQQDTPWVTPRMCIATQPRDVRLEEKRLREYPPSFEPDLIKFRTRVAEELAEIPLTVHALAFYKMGLWDEAKSRFERVVSDEARLYEGLCWYEKAKAASEPRAFLEAAIAVYHRVTPDGGWGRARALNSLQLVVLGNLANALQVLATVCESAQCRSYLEKAIAHYTTVMDMLSQEELPQEWALIQNNLGAALNELGTRLGGEEGNRRIQEAIEAYRAALRVRTEKELPQDWAGTQNNLGNTLTNIGTRLGGEEGKRRIREAIDAYRAALRVRTEKELPQGWAATQNNLGAALNELGIRLEGEEGNRLIQEAIDAYRAALRVRTEKELPQDWAMTQKNMGARLRELGTRLGGKEGNRLIQEAIDAYRAALRVYTEKELPQDWAMTQNNLGSALSDLGTRLGGEDGERLLEEAIVCCDSALRVYHSDHFPWHNQETRMNRERAEKALQDLKRDRR